MLAPLPLTPFTLMIFNAKAKIQQRHGAAKSSICIITFPKFLQHSILMFLFE